MVIRNHLQNLYARLAKLSVKNKVKYKTSTRLTPNFTPSKVNMKLGVLLHHTGGAYPGCVEWMANPSSKVGCHLVITKSGDRVVMATDNACTWHAGESSWNGRRWCNNFMIGVEFEGDTNNSPLTQNQINSFVEWFRGKQKLYKWTEKSVTDHRTVSPGRKVDLNLNEFRRVITAISNEPNA
jgi:N-acetyl-anhydromuramyl-L-alanine amidase AmpD